MQSFELLFRSTAIAEMGASRPALLLIQKEERRGPVLGALAGVARVPIHFARHVHHDCQHDEERDCAHKQRVILLPQGDVEKCVNARESCADH
jgi:hypothetical protein